MRAESVTGLSILIVEDELLIAEDIAFNLKKMGYQPKILSENTDDAIGFIENENVDLVILDISLKGEKNGISIAREMKEKLDIPIIFLTSHTSLEVISMATSTNPSAYLVKPYSIKQLLTSIHIALSNHTTKGAKNSVNNHEQPKELTYHLANSIFIKHKNRFVKLKYDEIYWLKARSNYTEIMSVKGTFLISITLKSTLGKIGSLRIIKIHRSYAINLDYVESFDGNIVFIKDERFSISEQYRGDFFKRFNVI